MQFLHTYLNAWGYTDLHPASGWYLQRKRASGKYIEVFVGCDAQIKH